ncbi:MAG: hypothetical protein GF331_19205, partial [Chitinivibrionales bacterium]|nr:hypothetical protein [Chitinivibrionales bacterium]
MRTLNSLFALLVLAATLAAQPPIAVLDFDGEGLSESERRALTNKLRSALFQTGSYTILERSRMEEILREMGFQQTGCTDMSCAVEMGQLLNVRFIVMGSVDKVASTYAVNARMVEVATGTIRADVVED